MRKLILLTILPALLIILISSFNTYGQNECIELNQKGWPHFDKYINYNGGSRQLDTALSLYKKAIKCDPHNFTAYMNMRTIYTYMSNYKMAIAMDNEILKIYPSEPFFPFDKGMLFDKINKTDSANFNYRLAKARYSVKLKTDSNKSWIISKIVLLTALTNGKAEALKELNRQIKAYPQLSELNDTTMFGKTYFLKDFNRKAYIKAQVAGPIPQYKKASTALEKKYEQEIEKSIRTPVKN
jgi:tetratricopeptide (TPR) repeat protein